jgi:3-(3-hydroxy-phenyl)propionate hydroxylase
MDGLPLGLRTAVESDPEISLFTGEEAVPLLESVQARAAVVRPDRYVLGTAQTPNDLERLLALLPTLTRDRGKTVPTAS